MPMTTCLAPTRRRSGTRPSPHRAARSTAGRSAAPGCQGPYGRELPTPSIGSGGSRGRRAATRVRRHRGFDDRTTDAAPSIAPTRRNRHRRGGDRQPRVDLAQAAIFPAQQDCRGPGRTTRIDPVRRPLAAGGAVTDAGTFRPSGHPAARIPAGTTAARRGPSAVAPGEPREQPDRVRPLDVQQLRRAEQAAARQSLDVVRDVAIRVVGPEEDLRRRDQLPRSARHPTPRSSS